MDDSGSKKIQIKSQMENSVLVPEQSCDNFIFTSLYRFSDLQFFFFSLTTVTDEQPWGQVGHKVKNVCTLGFMLCKMHGLSLLVVNDRSGIHNADEFGMVVSKSDFRCLLILLVSGFHIFPIL